MDACPPDLPTRPIQESALREFIKARPTLRLLVVGRGSEPGYVIYALHDRLRHVLHSTRKKEVVFATLDAAANRVRILGARRFAVDLANYQEGIVRAPRPDRADALRGKKSFRVKVA